MTTIAAGTSGRLANIHRAAGSLGRALEALPEWATLREQYDTLDAMAPVPPAGSAEQRVAGLLVEQLAHAAPNVMSLTKLASKAAAEQSGAAMVAAAVNRQRSDLANALDAAVSAGASDLFRHLDGALQSLLVEARGVFTELGGVRCAEDAIDAGLVETWRRVAGLEDRYADLRGAQARVWVLVEANGRAVRQVLLAYLADPAAVDGDFFARRAHRPIAKADGTTRPPRAAAWPADPWDGSALRWFAEHPKSKPWIPSMTELAELEDELAAESRRRYVADIEGRRVTA